MEVENMEQIANQIAEKPFIAVERQSFNSNVIKADCEGCCLLKSICDGLTHSAKNNTGQYNSLLSSANSLVACCFRAIGQIRQEYQDALKELHQSKHRSGEQAQEHQTARQKWQHEKNELRQTIFHKELIIEELYQHTERQINKQNDICSENRELMGACEKLAKHSRERSTLCLNLQDRNEKLAQRVTTLENENKRLSQEHEKMQDAMQVLSDYVSQIEQDLRENNIKSPKMLELGGGHPCDSSLPQSKDSIGDESDILHRTFLESETANAMAHISSGTSPCSTNRNVLKEILNISVETNEYFNLGIRCRDDSPREALVDGSLDKGDDSNQTLQQASSNFGAIDNFESRDKIHRAANQQEEVSAIDESGVTAIGPELGSVGATDRHLNRKGEGAINPYYAFFVMTVQCAKLNWGCLEEVANIDLSEYWTKLQDSDIAYNKWYSCIREVLKSKCQQQQI